MTDSTNYRFARPAEIGDIAALVGHSFPGPGRSPEWLRDQLATPRFGGGADTLFVGESGGRPVAACQVHPLRQWVGAEELACTGIGTVAVSPTHRRRGIGAELVAAALRAAHERGDVVSALYPFRVGFYQELGYGQAGEAHQYHVPPRMLPDAPERTRVILVDDDDGRDEVLAFYNAWARTQNGQLTRTPRMWAEQVMKHDRALVGYRNGGALEGYALAIYRADLPAAERYLEIDEMAWVTPGARRGLYAWVAALGDQWHHVLIRGLPSHRLGDWIREPRLPTGSAPHWQLWAPQATLMAGTMFRVLDMQRAWERRRARGGGGDSSDVATSRGAGSGQPPVDITFDVRDEQLPGNSGTWRVVLEEDGTRVERGDAVQVASPAGATPGAGSNSGRCTIRLNVSTLSRLYAGALPATAAIAAGLAECDRPEALPGLDAALKLPEPWTFDRF